MGMDNCIICVDCKEHLCVARNRYLYRDSDSINHLEAFLTKHADHSLIYERDDDWVRVGGTASFHPGDAFRKDDDFGLSICAAAAVKASRQKEQEGEK